ncbi:MAG TPA: ABC transporter permease [Kiritimatiellia bacterium]|nr:ABC transporter permease [Kiritimatiellia bacterium]HOR97977.1 ABC transporter permease [Kiritimatiellia bacterium]HPC48641.1 ABC transporter permease [Kiritimatiellia bacterium]
MNQITYFWPFVKLGLTDVWRHKTRSFLTMLGMVFGVGSVIAMLAVGEGASQQALESIKRLGSENIMVLSVKPGSEESGSSGAQRGKLAVYGLLYDDEKRIRETVPGVVMTVAARMTRRTARLNERQLEMRVVETVPEWFQVVQRPILAGRVLTAHDMRIRANVCVLTEHGVRRLLAAEETIGQRIRIASGVFEVIGIVQNETGGSVRAPDSEADAYIPITTGTKFFGEANIRYSAGGMEGEKVELSQIIVKMADTSVVESGSKAIQAVLERFHKKKDFRIDVPLTLLREAERTKRTYNIVLGAIAGISLLVGGIGIMNIMLASVTERTKEIGIRRAIGARRSRIVVQFLINTCVLSIGGGFVGLILGVAIPFLITLFTDMPTVVQPYSLVLAFGISAGIGIVFGLYPAMRAAALDPIEALRRD